MKKPAPVKTRINVENADGGKVLAFRAEKPIDDGNAAPTVFEIIPSHLTDALCQRIGAQVSNWVQAQSCDVSFAQMWMLARTGGAFLMMAGAGDQVRAVAIWRLEQWASDVCFRCIGCAGTNPETWVPQFFELARAHAQSSGAKHLIWENYDQSAAPCLPDGAKLLRQTYAMEV